MNEFITTLAWVFGVLATTLTALRIVGWMLYTEADALLDRLKGREASFPVYAPGTIAIVCWAWIISQ